MSPTVPPTDRPATPDRLIASSAVVMPDEGRVEVVAGEVDTGNLGPEEVVVGATFSVISPGTELAHYRGHSADGALVPTGRMAYPFHPGYAMAGTVLAAGPDSGLELGQRVLSHTPHASVARFDRAGVVCVPLPGEVDDRVAPFARLAQVGGVSLQLSAARAGDLVAVVGLGAIGNLAAQLARAAGCEVVGIDLSGFRREVASRSGVEWVGDGEEAKEHVAAAGGARVVLECSGRAAGVVLAVDLCSRHGEVFTVGAPWTRDAEVPASAVLTPVFTKYLNLRSGWEWQVPRYGDGYGRSIVGCTTWVLQQLAAGTVRTEDLVTGVIPPSDAAKAYERLSSDPDHAVTFLIDWRTGGEKSSGP